MQAHDEEGTGHGAHTHAMRCDACLPFLFFSCSLACVLLFPRPSGREGGREANRDSLLSPFPPLPFPASPPLPPPHGNPTPSLPHHAPQSLHQHKKGLRRHGGRLPPALPRRHARCVALLLTHLYPHTHVAICGSPSTYTRHATDQGSPHPRPSTRLPPPPIRITPSPHLLPPLSHLSLFFQGRRPPPGSSGTTS